MSSLNSTQNPSSEVTICPKNDPFQNELVWVVFTRWSSSRLKSRLVLVVLSLDEPPVLGLIRRLEYPLQSQ